MHYFFMICISGAMFLSACANNEILSAQPGPNTKSMGTYAIPKTVFEVTVELEYRAQIRVGNDWVALANPTEVSLEFDLEPKIVPAKHVELNYLPSIYSDDSLSIELEPEGYLKTVTMSSNDQSSAIVKAITDVGIGLAKVDAVFTPRTVYTLKDGVVTEELSFVFDPNDDLARSFSVMNGRGDIDISASDLGAVGLLSEGNAELDGVPGQCQGKICYPKFVARTIEIRGPSGSFDEKLVYLPDPNNLVSLDVSRAKAVQKQFEATFSAGVLTKVSVGKPSEALSVASAPLDFLTSIVAVPAELIQLKVDTTNKEAGVLEAQKGLLEAQTQLIESMKLYEEAKREGGGGPPRN